MKEEYILLLQAFFDTKDPTQEYRLELKARIHNPLIVAERLLTAQQILEYTHEAFPAGKES